MSKILITSDKNFKTAFDYDGGLRLVKNIIVHNESGMIYFRITKKSDQEMKDAQAEMIIHDGVYQISTKDLIESAKFYGFIDRIPVGILENQSND